MDNHYFLIIDDRFGGWVIIGQTRARTTAEAILNIQDRYWRRLELADEHYQIIGLNDEIFEVVHDFACDFGQSLTNDHNWVLEGF